MKNETHDEPEYTDFHDRNEIVYIGVPASDFLFDE